MVSILQRGLEIIGLLALVGLFYFCVIDSSGENIVLIKQVFSRVGLDFFSSSQKNAASSALYTFLAVGLTAVFAINCYCYLGVNLSDYAKVLQTQGYSVDQDSLNLLPLFLRSLLLESLFATFLFLPLALYIWLFPSVIVIQLVQMGAIFLLTSQLNLGLVGLAPILQESQAAIKESSLSDFKIDPGLSDYKNVLIYLNGFILCFLALLWTFKKTQQESTGIFFQMSKKDFSHNILNWILRIPTFLKIYIRVLLVLIIVNLLLILFYMSTGGTLYESAYDSQIFSTVKQMFQKLVKDQNWVFTGFFVGIRLFLRIF